jgi:aldose 1-epimerase
MADIPGGAAAGGAATVTREPWGSTLQGTVDRYTLDNGDGMRVQIITYGGIMQSIEVPDRHGRSVNVALGFNNLQGYVEQPGPYFGALIGRYGNRISRGRFLLDGQTHHVPINNPPNSLHGGTVGFDKHIWAATPVPGPRDVGLTVHHISPDGDQGYPGTLTITVHYTLTPDNTLRIDYRATTDAPTVLNLTNHSYFNLFGEGTRDIYDHQLQINASHFTPVDASLIPTGQLATVAETPLDFRQPTAIGARIRTDHPQLLHSRGYDHNYVLDRHGDQLSLAARAWEPTSGRTLTVHTTEPGMQFYSGNFLDGSFTGTSGHTYRQGDGFALETQHFPDSPNHPAFPSTVLRPEQTYLSTTVFGFGVAGADGPWSGSSR